MTAWALYEVPILDRCVTCGGPASAHDDDKDWHGYSAEDGNPVLVGVAPTAAIAERWRDEPAEGVRREISPVAVIDGERLAAGIRRLATPPTRIEDCP